MPGPGLSAVIWPPCSSTMRLTMDRPRPVELSPAVGLADRRWKRPNRRDMSSGDRPGPLSRHRDQRVVAVCARPRCSMRPPIGEYLMALLTRLSIASRRRSGSPLTVRRPAPSIAMRCSLACRAAAGWSRPPRCTSAGDVDRLPPDADVERVRHGVGQQRIDHADQALGRIADMLDLRAHLVGRDRRRRRENPSSSRCGR